MMIPVDRARQKIHEEDSVPLANIESDDVIKKKEEDVCVVDMHHHRQRNK